MRARLSSIAESVSAHGTTNRQVIGPGDISAVGSGRAIDGNDLVCRKHIMLAPGRTVDKAQHYIGGKRKREALIFVLEPSSLTWARSQHYLGPYDQR